MPDGAYARSFAGVIEALAQKGHKIVVALETQAKNLNDAFSLGGLPDNRIEIAHLPIRRSSLLWGVTSNQIAAVWDSSSRWLASHRSARAESHLMGPIRFLNWVPRKRREWAVRSVVRACAWIYEILPPNRRVLRDIRIHDPDVVLVTPLVDPGSKQHDYVKACRHLRLPVGCCVANWGDLAGKRLIKAQPDRVFVWNEAQKAEAVVSHGVPEQRVVVTGAQILDRWFDAKPALSRAEFCKTVGLSPLKPILLYVASGLSVHDEVGLVLKWIRALRSCDDSSLREAAILIRPDPIAEESISRWDHPHLKTFKNVVVFPKSVELGREAQDYCCSLHHSAAVVGSNISALLEASIVGCPIFIIPSDEARDAQEGLTEFENRARECVKAASTFDEHIEQLQVGVKNLDEVTPIFVERFLRPYGIGQPATEVFVAEVEEMEDLTVEGPSLRARFGVLQRWVLLPLVLAFGIARAMTLSLGVTRAVYGRGQKPPFRSAFGNRPAAEPDAA
jgi:hypothetical protein